MKRGVEFARPGQVRNLANLAFATSMAAELASARSVISRARKTSGAAKHAQALAKVEPNLAQAKLTRLLPRWRRSRWSCPSDRPGCITCMRVGAGDGGRGCDTTHQSHYRTSGMVVRPPAALTAEIKLRRCVCWPDALRRRRVRA